MRGATRADWGGYSFGSQLVGIQNESSVSQALPLLAGDYDPSRSNAGRRGYAAASYQVLFNDALSGTFNTSGGDRWATEQLSFNLSGTTAGALKVQGLNVAGDGTAFIDDVVLTARIAQVPEPQSLALALVALALLGLGAVRRRQRSR